MRDEEEEEEDDDDKGRAQQHPDNAGATLPLIPSLCSLGDRASLIHIILCIVVGLVDHYDALFKRPLSRRFATKHFSAS